MNEKGKRIRNGQIRRDFKRLLTIFAETPFISNDIDKDYELLSEVEAIAERNALYFDDEGEVKEISEEGR